MGLKTGLAKTRTRLSGGFSRFLLGKVAPEEDLFDEIESLLLGADVGIEATDRITGNLRKRVKRKHHSNAELLHGALREEMISLLRPCEQPLVIPKHPQRPFVILMVGVNGAGKTTTIGKLAHRFLEDGRSLALAAGDTFRAAAVAQLEAWGKRDRVHVMTYPDGSDPAAVAYESLETAAARGIDVLIIDTAGRLHTQTHLMEQLKKVRRVLGKVDPNAPQETLLIIDATTGQNALHQAIQFHQAVNVTGIILTKLDGTAKGGIIFAIAERLGIPVRFLGVGEGVDDLQEFNAEAFVDALLDEGPD